MEAEKQLSDKKVYQEVSNSEIILSKLAEMSNKIFGSLKKKKLYISKFYFLPKIYKKLHNVPARPVILKCGTPKENCSEFFDYHLKPLKQRG